jgi:hypothetical protein
MVEKNRLEAQFLHGISILICSMSGSRFCARKIREVLANLPSPALQEPELQDDL